MYALPCVLSSFAIILTKRKELVALLCAFLVSCGCYCSVAHGTMSCSAVFDCGIFDHIHLLLETFRNDIYYNFA